MKVFSNLLLGKVGGPAYDPSAPPLARYTCSGSPNYTCTEDQQGEYASLLDCLMGCFGEPAPEPGENECNDCGPAIPDDLYVTLSGLGGDFAARNGTHHLVYVDSCNWSITFGEGDFIELSWQGEVWSIGVVLNASTCYVILESAGSGDCTPWSINPYLYVACTDSGCVGACAASASATATVNFVAGSPEGGECDPEPPATFIVTLGSLGGALAGYNGAHTVNWYGGYNWWKDLGDGFILILQAAIGIPGSEAWGAAITNAAGTCMIGFYHRITGEEDPCDPTALSFALSGCADIACSGMCAASTSATCAVT